MQRTELVKYLDNLLQKDKFKDYCPNGLQIEGSLEIKKIICGVSLSQDLIDIAIKDGADTIIVHHGIFWNKDDYAITGIKYQRIAKLIKNNINLIVYHLPLDNHEIYGNNVQLAKQLGIKIIGQNETQSLIWHGTIPDSTLKEFTHKYQQITNHQPITMGNENKIIKNIAWCTGGADSFFNQVINMNVDCYITGEINEPIKSLAEESGVAYIAGGHYVTERYGIKAISQLLLEKFSLDSQFVELYNPI
ncbi:MAG: Nif3-like dinuclear metal center hexameric protein [Burkholderiales bacterium]|nr:Nif3-like dinuclear metal center hexameric protein [Burkholderiales bacterium]